MISFFTMFHLDIGEREMHAMERKFYLVPLIGFILGGVASLACLLLELAGVTSTAALAAVALFVILFLTKFLHFDGLTDFGDGMIASGDREKHIRALKDSLVGAGGVGVAMLVTLMSFAFLSGLERYILIATVWPMEIMVKNAMVSACAFGIPGNGMAGEQVRLTTCRSLVSSTLFAFALALLAFLITGLIADPLYGFTILDGHGITCFFRAVIVSLILSILSGYVMAKVANGQFGFVNGDVCGATNEMSRAVMLLGILILASNGWI